LCAQYLLLFLQCIHVLFCPCWCIINGEFWNGWYLLSLYSCSGIIIIIIIIIIMREQLQ
jgi:hypothetical protein